MAHQCGCVLSTLPTATSCTAISNKGFNILCIYEHERNQYIQRELTYLRSNIQNPVPVVPTITVTVLSTYVKCEGDCGICYESACNVMLNCKHQFCVGCLKGQFKIAKTTGKFNCAFCRADIRSINASDYDIRKVILLLDK